MVAVAVVGLLAYLEHRRRSFESLAAYHRDRVWRMTDRHAVLSEKYSYAARHPWLPVEPDPPEPVRNPQGVNRGS
jgi:hypothetical protein